MTIDEGKKYVSDAQDRLNAVAEFDTVAKLEMVALQAIKDAADARAKIAPIIAHRRELDKASDAIKAFEARKLSDMPSDAAYNVLKLFNVPVDQLVNL